MIRLSLHLSAFGSLTSHRVAQQENWDQCWCTELCWFDNQTRTYQHLYRAIGMQHFRRFFQEFVSWKVLGPAIGFKCQQLCFENISTRSWWPLNTVRTKIHYSHIKEWEQKRERELLIFNTVSLHLPYTVSSENLLLCLMQSFFLFFCILTYGNWSLIFYPISLFHISSEARKNDSICSTGLKPQPILQQSLSNCF